MKKATVTPMDQMKKNTDEKLTKIPLENVLKDKNNIKDYDRAWEDDRL